MIKLLLVDDEKKLCEFLMDFFKLRGFSVLIATNGQDALALVKKEKPKIVFLDIQMLGMSGLEVLKEIKQIDSSIKVIMVTVMDDEKTKNEAKRLGADEFVSKPFITDYLEEVVVKKVTELLQKPKILVVDDEEDVRERLSRIIAKRINCEVEKAANGEEALSKLKQDKFDLVLLDIKMPGLSGIDVMQEAVKFTPQTKFLAISGYDSHEVADSALKAGAIDFISKPQTPESLEIKIKDVLSQIGKYQPKKY